MASIDPKPTPSGKRRVRWREWPAGPQRYKDFPRKVDAERFKVDLEHRLMVGTYTPPEAGLMTVAAYAAEWTARRHWRAATKERRERELRLHILPELGARPLSSLRRVHVEEWAAALPLAPSSVGAAFETLRALLEAAVDDERIGRNPASGARLPKVEDAPFVPLTVEAVRALALGTVEHIRAGVLVAAGTGLRQGELFGLTVDRVDFLRRELRVDRQLWTPKAGRPFLAAPKSPRSYRTVALSGLVVDALAAHLAAHGPGEHGVVFHIDGRAVSRSMGSAYMRRAVTAAGKTAAKAAREAAKGLPEAEVERLEAAARAELVGTTWHDCRHHHASVLLSRGVSPAKVAERLGHTVTELLKTYAHALPADDDRVRSIVDETLGGSAECWLSAGAV